MQSTPLPDLDDWHTIHQVIARRPALTERSIQRFCDQGLLPFYKRGTGQTSPRLYKLADVDRLIEGTFVPATKGPLAQATDD